MIKGQKIILKPKVCGMSWVRSDRHSPEDGSARQSSLVAWKRFISDRAARGMRDDAGVSWAGDHYGGCLAEEDFRLYVSIWEAVFILKPISQMGPLVSEAHEGLLNMQIHRSWYWIWRWGLKLHFNMFSQVLWCTPWLTLSERSGNPPSGYHLREKICPLPTDANLILYGLGSSLACV